MIGIVDYGVGNLFSVARSLEYLAIERVITSDWHILEQCDQIILPGVGAFSDAMSQLKATKLIEPIQQLANQGKPLLGICLGMQLLFEESEEFGSHQGLGLIGGRVVSLKNAFNEQNIQLKVPHIGWNALKFQQTSPLISKITENDQVYYVHSFYATDCAHQIVATSEYGINVPGIVQQNNVFGAQFHPEKSGQVGLNILKAFSEVKG
ncbi:imidazole glycerol phosphate synthase subunit HisH [Enterococcus columbae]|uniref:Imidazole glycerol phosphate synthase subunit HisH n=1 Tax=Enterococcus columbae DSM 7374 = ATCC 51263 TaxID=1121865 RepID=S0KVL8_9ENTE|nr:imidazole glycerol phosphate synthase subunit HisH [Enterococcus columbae]EOT44178.1 imidazole glycerol phosphate synthase, glutamine amidotransferase subunit [Enterococcus columbae DSM 7374 = ATCC 51263]EOW84336.1 imidazole glycerol phosphate synthase, glutamine amidotransferase subunit [Enterococcus columbae DSM 7374 = ATCC 51263]OJG26106.1 imidazole glycerol phosphate synthase, glutamine amidotransferase subunit [Enterococcus columbae DSM 7374 = ATCC 51263]